MPKKKVYKWLDAAKSYAQISGILAGFCIVFITLLLTSTTRSETKSQPMIEIVVIFFSVAAFGFIFAAEKYTTAILHVEKKRFNRASDFYNLSIILMLAGLVLMFKNFNLSWAVITSVIILGIEVFLVLRVVVPRYLKT